MSRFARNSGDDLAYGDYNRWDRDRFDRGGRGPPAPPEPPRRFEEDFRFVERDRPGRRDIIVEDRVETRGPRGRVDERERDRIFQETFGDRPRRRTDRELFGDVDPRELAEMAMTPYKPKAEPRPGMIRRQSSLDTFDRRRIPRYDKEDYRLPVRREEEERESSHHRGAEDESYHEIEVKRERSVHRHGGKKSKAPTVASSSSSSSSAEEVEKFEKISRRSHSPPRPGFKKGKTRMPKRMVFREAIMDLGHPFVEEDDFFVLQVALEKDQIDEVIKVSEMYKTQDSHKVYRYDKAEEESATSVSTVRKQSPERGGREEIIRKEFINPPSEFLGSHASRRSRSSRRAHSPSIESSISQRISPARTARTARTAHTARTSSSRARTARSSHSHARGTVVEERKTVVEEGGRPLPGPEFFEERKTVIEERGAPSSHHSEALVVQERETRSDRDIHAEIRALEAERRALRLEREAEDKHGLAHRIREHRSDDDYQLVEYRDGRPRREVLEIVERDRSPPRNIVRVEKDRKARRGPNPKLVAAAMATLT